MFEEYERKKRKQVSIMRSVLDYGMGIVIFLIGVFFFFRGNFKHLSINEKYPPDYLDKVFGSFCLLYGAWRIYRGYKKKYFR